MAMAMVMVVVVIEKETGRKERRAGTVGCDLGWNEALATRVIEKAFDS